VVVVDFLELPDGCHYVGAPFPIHCLVQQWIDGGCLSEGWGHPMNSSNPTLLELESRNIV